MSAFAQHDDIDVVVEGPSCPYCDTPALLVDYGSFVEGVHQVLRVDSAPLYLCGAHWLVATRNADRANITHHGPVNTLFAS